MQLPVAACLALCVAGIVQAVVMLVHGWEHRRYHRSRLASKLQAFPPPRATLFVPCRGVDVDMEANLRALFSQQYGPLDLCFLVEGESDPAVAVIGRLQTEFPTVASRIVFTGRAVDCGQKVHNLIRGTETVSRASVILAFIDSDARPHALWLARLVDRLHSGKCVVATGYRWYVPVSLTLANRILSAINNTVGGMMGSHGFNLVWGGAWAIRADFFREIGLPGAWRGSLSDDLVVSRLVRSARLKVAYEPHCLVRSPAEFTWGALAEFLRRQYLVGRVYAPTWWGFAVVSSIFTNAVLCGLTAFGLWWAVTAGPWTLPTFILLFIYLLTAMRRAFHADAVRPFLDISQAKYQRVTRINIWGWPIISLINGLGLAASAIGRTIVWRGIRYRLDSPSRTQILDQASGGPQTESVPRPATRAA